MVEAWPQGHEVAGPICIPTRSSEQLIPVASLCIGHTWPIELVINCPTMLGDDGELSCCLPTPLLPLSCPAVPCVSFPAVPDIHVTLDTVTHSVFSVH